MLLVHPTCGSPGVGGTVTDWEWLFFFLSLSLSTFSLPFGVSFLFLFSVDWKGGGEAVVLVCVSPVWHASALHDEHSAALLSVLLSSCIPHHRGIQGRS